MRVHLLMSVAAVVAEITTSGPTRPAIMIFGRRHGRSRAPKSALGDQTLPEAKHLCRGDQGCLLINKSLMLTLRDPPRCDLLNNATQTRGLRAGGLGGGPSKPHTGLCKWKASASVLMAVWAPALSRQRQVVGEWRVTIDPALIGKDLAEIRVAPSREGWQRSRERAARTSGIPTSGHLAPRRSLQARAACRCGPWP